jgi:hypothetical protein
MAMLPHGKAKVSEHWFCGGEIASATTCTMTGPKYLGLPIFLGASEFSNKAILLNPTSACLCQELVFVLCVRAGRLYRLLNPLENANTFCQC